MNSVDVEIFSDFICPWCYIGKERLQKVVQALHGEIEINLITRPYILYPHIPPGGVDKSVFAKKSKPGMGRSLRKEAAIDGLDLNYQLIERIPNSKEAHRLISIVNDPSKKYPLTLEIIRAYFQNGEDIEDRNILTQYAQKVGIDHSVLEEFHSPSYSPNHLEDEISIATNAYVTIVPTLRLNGVITIPGLQSAEVWTTYLKRASVMKS